ncbi:MAG: hypothetical protein LBD30_04230 [Verrucomicrobiales bacterium]|nr:hypothetical protein [Verrucomicrobiales bacterium]
MEVLRRHPVPTVKTMLADGVYTDQSFAADVRAQLPEARVEIVKRQNQSAFVLLPKCWIVERTFG